ncbi:MAG TPA: tRNA lysidine(34) synthetase TilS [Candidatus Sulfotelmatobacter sp.]|nr:tRNA lysidine(34) synthetase TilS [Candidatus Sulfotelmatobacter sp.]
MHNLAQCLLGHVREHELLKPGDRVGVAVSGGIDSIALLRMLLELRGELGIVLSLVHFNHKLRGAESDGDEEFVARLAREHDLEFICDSDDVAGHAREQGVSLETAARELRYGFFRYLIRSGTPDTTVKIPTSGKIGQKWGTHVTKILTGHTLDDQAETVLMRIIRGAGLRGLAGIHPRIAVEDDEGELCGEIVRPLLAIRRRELEQYLKEIRQPWREDATNTDESFTRNRVRKLLVPLLEKEFNPAISESLSELAEIARGEEDYWDNELSGWMGTGVHWSRPEWAGLESTSDALVQIVGLGTVDAKTPTSRAQNVREMGHPFTGASSNNDELNARIENAPWLVMNASVDRLWFLGEPVAVQRRVIKAIGDEAGVPLEFRHIEETLRFASEEAGSGKELSLPLGWKIVRHPDELLFVTPDLRTSQAAQDFEYKLEVPGRVEVPEAGLTLEARRISAEEAGAYNPDQLLNADSVTGPLVVRNWRAGDRFWPAHTKSPKKIKELLQERHIPQPERRLWPVVESGDEIIWIRGFPVSARYAARGRVVAVVLVETQWAKSSTS